MPRSALRVIRPTIAAMKASGPVIASVVVGGSVVVAASVVVVGAAVVVTAAVVEELEVEGVSVPDWLPLLCGPYAGDHRVDGTVLRHLADA